MSNKKVDELVEWAAEQINKIPQDGYKYGKDCAKQILSHKDLALIDKDIEFPRSMRECSPKCDQCRFWYSQALRDMVERNFNHSIIPLTEAIKESDEQTNR